MARLKEGLGTCPKMNSSCNAKIPVPPLYHTRIKFTVVYQVNLKKTQNVIQKIDRLMVNFPPTFPEIVIIK